MTHSPRTPKWPGKLVSLFCGAGGMDLGLKRAGFDFAVAVDAHPDAVRSWNTNLKGNEARQVDLESPGSWLDLVNATPATLPIGIVGGPPCQGLSRARSNGVADDPRRRSPIGFALFCLFASQRRPLEFVVMENVETLIASRNQDILGTVERIFEKASMTTTTVALEASAFGVPQRRRRAFLVASSPEVMARWSPPSGTVSAPTVRDAIGGLPNPAFNSAGSGLVVGNHHPNHVTSRPTSRRFATKDFNRWRSFRRIDWDDQSPTVAYGNREIHVHPDGERRLSVFEAMLLQGFPRDAVLHGTFSSQVKQVSNAVPPPIAEAIGRSVHSALMEVL